MRTLIFAFGLVFLISLSGCSKSTQEEETILIPIRIQTDWFPQVEHGGFYQALAKGFYAEAGLDVTILPGGPNAQSVQKMIAGRADFAMNRADTILKMRTQGVDAQLVMATLQHDPQVLLIHASNPVRTLKDLDRHRVMASPGAAWIDFVRKRFGVNIEIIPHDYGIERFLQDPTFIQQGLLTNEPYYAIREKIDWSYISLKDSGYDPYHGIYCLDQLINEHPDVVQAFVQASIQGWEDFITGDPTPAFQLISEKNPKMTQEFMQFSYHSLQAHRLVKDQSARERTGHLNPKRLVQLETDFKDLGLIDQSFNEKWWTTEFIEAQSSTSVSTQ